ncbi:TPA: epimerase [Klebsiella aerogenes]|nr:epimerase [Klebsiella aerogenes]EKZ6357660.1 epimerase [Klebsiella aerogenes]HBR7301126.1 epimerase [Klebsiella aerogenes]
MYDLVGFKPQTSVKEGVKNFVEWYKAYYKS